MQHEREHERYRHHPPGGDDPDPEAPNRSREEMEDIFRLADEAMNAMLQVEAEQFLRQRRQACGQ